ncbi:MAG: cation diffusion facilitator family transporter [Treponema sp.]|jgi:cation diffusion facilitator family transporter|nr:cation diffusion facilitator family transporter [Treponema sp.]
MKRKTVYIRIAAITALIGNTLLAALKIGAGIASRSDALIGDGIDSSSDALIAIITLVLIKVIVQPADSGHPWGHGRAETVATALLSFLIFFAGAQLIFNSAVSLIFHKEQAIPSTSSVIAALISITGKIFLAWSQYFFGIRADSAFLKANAKNMAGDVLVSLAVLIGLSISIVTGIGAVDSIAALLVGIWIIKTAVNIFIEANLELMDGSSNTEPYKVVFDAVKSVKGAASPHRTRMRRIAGFWDIDIDIEVDPQLKVDEAHAIASQVESEIKLRLDNVYDIMIHIEPQGDSKAGEGYGLSEEDINRDTRRRT